MNAERWRKHAGYMLAILSVVVFGALFFHADRLAQSQIENSRELHNLLSRLGTAQARVHEALLKEAFFAYHDYDEINHALRHGNELLEQIKERTAGIRHPRIHELLDGIEREMRRRESAIQKFQTLNAIIKNSALQLPRLLNRYLDRKKRMDQEYLRLLSRIVSEITLGKTSLDADLMPHLELNIRRLYDWHFTDPADERFNAVFIRHAQVIHDNLAEYIHLLDDIEDNPVPRLLGTLDKVLDESAQETLATIRRTHLVLALAFSSAVLIIMILLVRTHRENLRLQALQEELTRAATTDGLTGLGNRVALERREFDRPTLLLINIDQFKHINDFYGVAAGDAIIRQIVNVMRHVIDRSLHDRLYRIGGDDFALVLEEQDAYRPERLAQQLIQAVERHAFVHEGSTIPVSISIGISCTEPLLETADLALRSVKKTRSHLLEYSATAHLEDEVAENLRMIQIIRDALREGRVVPYFQPILDNRSGRIDKYECLMRIRMEDGRCIPPARFLHIAREARLAGELTRAMIESCLARFADNDFQFSINFSIEDMLDQRVTSHLFYELERRPELASRLTIELLESEEIGDYMGLRNFITHLRRLGCRLAVDDFGAGYSNLSQVLQLDVDQIKIDASLIRNLDSDPKALATVRAILEFARAANIPSVVAEFVHSEQIQNIVVDLGIDHSQGYWIGKPEPDLLDEHRQPIT